MRRRLEDAEQLQADGQSFRHQPEADGVGQRLEWRRKFRHRREPAKEHADGQSHATRLALRRQHRQQVQPASEQPEVHGQRQRDAERVQVAVPGVSVHETAARGVLPKVRSHQLHHDKCTGAAEQRQVLNHQHDELQRHLLLAHRLRVRIPAERHARLAVEARDVRGGDFDVRTAGLQLPHTQPDRHLVHHALWHPRVALSRLLRLE